LNQRNVIQGKRRGAGDWQKHQKKKASVEWRSGLVLGGEPETKKEKGNAQVGKGKKKERTGQTDLGEDYLSGPEKKPLDRGATRNVVG